MPARSAFGRPFRNQPRRHHQPPDIVVLALSDFHGEDALRRQQPRRLRNQRAIGVEPVAAAVERARRVEIPHLGGETGDIGRADVGRVRDDEIESARQVGRIIAGDEVSAIGEAEIDRIVVCCL